MNKKLKILISIILVVVLTNVTKLIENGVSPKAVQIRLGHKKQCIYIRIVQAKWKTMR